MEYTRVRRYEVEAARAVAESAEVLSYPTQSVLEDILQKLIPTQICQRILYISNGKG